MNQVNNNSLCYPSNADMDWSGRGGAMDWSGRGGGPSPMMWNPNPTQLPSPAVCPPQPPAPSAALPMYNTLPMYNNLNANLANANFQPPLESTGYIPDPNNPDGLWWRSGRYGPRIQFSDDMPVLPYSAEECYPPLSPDPIWEREREAERADRLREREVRRLERLRRVAGYPDW